MPPALWLWVFAFADRDDNPQESLIRNPAAACTLMLYYLVRACGPSLVPVLPKCDRTKRAPDRQWIFTARLTWRIQR